MSEQDQAEFEAWLDYWWDTSEWSGEDKEEGFLAFKAARRTQDEKVRELVEATEYLLFACRDGAVFQRDHARQRATAALAQLKQSQSDSPPQE